LIPRNGLSAEVFVKQGPTCSGDDQEEITWTLESKHVSTQGKHSLYLYHNEQRCHEVFVVKPTAEEPVFEVKIAANKLFCSKRSSIKNFRFQ
jgi:hypothetical protein